MNQPTEYPFPPGSGGFNPPPPKPVSEWKILAGILILALTALAAFVATSTFIEKKRDTSSQSSPMPSASQALPVEPESGDRTYVIEGGEGSFLEGECLAMGRSPEECKQERDRVYPSTPVAAPAPAPAPAPLPAGDREWAYTKDLMDNPTVTLKDPGRLVSLGNATCRYLEAASGTPDSNAERLLQFLTTRGASLADAEAIALGAMKNLCPQYLVKITG